MTRLIPAPRSDSAYLAKKRKRTTALLKREVAGKRSKYGAVKTVVDGIRFDSKAEARRYGELKLLECAKEIERLEIQPRYPISINGQQLALYIGDFRYFTTPKDGSRSELVVEDVKGVRTAVYRLKKRLVEALYPGVKIIEVAA